MARNLDRDKLDFGTGKIGPLFRALFFPTLVGMIFNSLLTLVDGIFVGQGVGANGIAAVNIVAPLFMVCTGIGLMMGIGASVIAGIRLSEDNVKSARIIMTLACYLFPLVFSIANAVAQSAQPIISFNYGAHQSGRVGRTLKVALLTAIICGLIITSGLWLGATPIVSAFLHPNETAFGIATHGLPLFATCSIFFAINATFIGYYQSIERAWQSILFTLLRGVIFLVPSFFILPRIIGTDGPWLAIPCAELLTLIAIIAYYTSHRIEYRHVRRNKYQFCLIFEFSKTLQVNFAKDVRCNPFFKINDFFLKIPVVFRKELRLIGKQSK